MGYTRDINGLLRMKTKYTPKAKKAYFPPLKVNKEESEDTRIRKDIHRIIIKKIGENKSNIEIEIYIRSMYPDYAEYIAKMVNDQFTKRGLNRRVEDSDIEIGDER